MPGTLRQAQGIRDGGNDKASQRIDPVTYHKNVALYWADDAPSDSVRTVVDTWKRQCPGWQVTLYSQRSANDFLEETYGGDISTLFRYCAIPAMQSDVFRVFWALSKGGIYSDLTFIPKTEPLFFSTAKPLTVPRWHHGRIVSGLFYAAENCAPLRLVAYEILKSLSLRTENNIWLATGPGAWIRAIGNNQTYAIAVIDKHQLYRDYVVPSDYASTTRGTDRHWSKVQQTTPIYARPAPSA